MHLTYVFFALFKVLVDLLKPYVHFEHYTFKVSIQCGGNMQWSMPPCDQSWIYHPGTLQSVSTIVLVFHMKIRNPQMELSLWQPILKWITLTSLKWKCSPSYLMLKVITLSGHNTPISSVEGVVLHLSPPCAAYMHQRIESALVQIMVCRLFRAKQLSKPMLVYLSIGPLGTNFSEILIKIKTFHS